MLTVKGRIRYLTFWREEGGRRHGLLNAFELVGLVADESCGDGVVALLDGTGPGHCNVQHRSVVLIEPLFFSLVEPVGYRIELLGLTTTTWILRAL